jgi:hypothetical protein
MVRRAILLAGCAASMGLAVLACTLNPQPLPPDQPEAGALTAAPDSGTPLTNHDASSSDGPNYGDALPGVPPDAGVDSARSDAEGGTDAETDAPADGGDADTDGGDAD